MNVFQIDIWSCLFLFPAADNDSDECKFDWADDFFLSRNFRFSSDVQGWR